MLQGKEISFSEITRRMTSRANRKTLVCGKLEASDLALIMFVGYIIGWFIEKEFPRGFTLLGKKMNPFIGIL